jgi:hypothetical protein
MMHRAMRCGLMLWAIGCVPTLAQEYAIELMTGDSVETLTPLLTRFAPEEHPRLIADPPLVRFLIGRYESKTEAEARAAQLSPQFPGAWVRSVERREATVVSQPQFQLPARSARPIAEPGVKSHERGERQPHLLSYQTRGQQLLDPQALAAAGTSAPSAAPAAKVSKPQRPQPVPTSARQPERPDERALWALFHRGELGQVHSTIASWRKHHRNWQPPPDLTRLLEQQAQDTEYQDAAEDPAALLELHQRQPQLFACSAPDRLGRLITAYLSQHDRAGASRQLDRLFHECQSDEARITTLERLHQQEQFELFEQYTEQELGLPRSAKSERRFAELVYRHRVSAFHEAFARGDDAQARRYLDQLEGPAWARRDVGVVMSFGWLDDRAGRPAAAVRWFEQALDWEPNSEQAALGLVLNARRSGNHELADTLASAWIDRSSRIEALWADSALECARESFAASQFELALERFEAVRERRALDPGDRELYAWALLRAGFASWAGVEFQAIYHQTPSESAAQGLMSAYQASGDETTLERFASETHGPIVALLERQRAREDYSRKQFQSAALRAADEFPELAGIDAVRVETGVLARSKSGVDGLGSLEVSSLPVASLRLTPGGASSLELTVSRVELDPGRHDRSTPVGTLTDPIALRSSDHSSEPIDGIEALASFRHDGRDAWQAQVGMTPSSGPFGARWLGAAGWRRVIGRGAVGVRAQTRPVRESLLSYTGRLDPATGTAWGAVDQRELRVDALIPLGSQWNANLFAGSMQLDGRDVARNSGTRWGLGASRSVASSSFDYLVIGPYLLSESYDRDLSHFTLGHGGYFSPQSMQQLGLATDFLTREARAFVMRGHIALGWQQHRSERTPYFPLNPTALSFPAVDESGLVFDTRVVGSWRLGKQLQLAAGIWLRRTADYDDRALLLTLRLAGQPRPALFSSDLPDPLWDQLY